MNGLVPDFYLRGGRGYADLLLAFQVGGKEELTAVAGLLGYGPAVIEPVKSPPPTSAPMKPQPVVVAENEAPPDEPATPFYFPIEYQARVPIKRSPHPPKQYQNTLPVKPPVVTELRRWSALFPRLRGEFAERAPGKALDVNALIALMAKGRSFQRLPRLTRLRWGSHIQIIVDRSERLIPFQEDQDRVARSLAALFPSYGVGFALYFDGFDQPVSLTSQGEYQEYRLPAPGALVVVLGDLGCLAVDPTRLVARWRGFGLRLAHAQCRFVALTPSPESRWVPDVSRLWRMVAWEGRGGGLRLSPAELEARAERLLRLLSPAVRIEPGLLRSVRLLLGSAADAGTEADLWHHRALVGRSRVAATLDRVIAKRLRDELERSESQKLYLKVMECLHTWRGGGLAPEVWYEELLNLSPTMRESLPESLQANDLPAAGQRLKQFAEQPTPLQLEWYKRVSGRATTAYYTQEDPELKSAQQKLELAAFQDDPDHPLPPGFDPALLPASREIPISIELRQQGGRMVAQGGGGSWLGRVESRNGMVRIGAVAEDPHFWKAGQPPAWADGWGWDRFGAWVTFSVGAVTQRMRWIPPGRFIMGSPEDEPGRDPDEGPQHEVTIRQGYWLFDTPCTQALWEGVLEQNPSQFKSPDRPVEQVSWDEVQRFVSELNERLPGLELGLPSEAQWEYACRAGTTSALYTGGIQILGEYNAPALDAIAWYGGNSGVNFDLENGEDLSSWPEKQYPDTPSGTHPVALKLPNAWGLYDMFGNVWEWCLDGMRGYDSLARTDPVGPEDVGVGRVVRGGAWYLTARGVRAASRFHFQPDARNLDLGFRCSRVPVSQASQVGAEPMEPASVRLAERRTVPAASSEAVLVVEGRQIKTDCLLPRRPLFQAESDCERLTFGRLTKPDWATAMGRDSVGVWAEIRLVSHLDQPVTQRLRWISPGRFLMGSPDNEPGRSDGEGPQHEVTISKGYWLFDTPCTQDLWQVVMGDNPSYFKGQDRPVEMVSWKDVQRFLARINQQLPTLELTLPSEAQWEYACRAGSASAIYAPELDAIAWYAGNSHQETHPVGQKASNAWGLYDMLGNVWVWCLDGGRTYDAIAQIDPVGSVEVGVRRVVRGGAWNNAARLVRAAFRSRNRPDGRNLNLGFRCSRVHS